jgi:hypothetical protein
MTGIIEEEESLTPTVICPVPFYTSWQHVSHIDKQYIINHCLVQTHNIVP